MSTAKVLAGDIGGTKTLLGLFDARPSRPKPLVVREYGTLDYPNLTAMISAFAAESDVHGVRVDVACLGVAGPVIGETAELTNVPWKVDAAEVARAFDIRRVALLNDLQAMAHAVPVLDPGELHTLQ